MKPTPLLHLPWENTPEGPSPKQRIYREMLFSTLPYLRNLSNLPWWARRPRYRRALAVETELIHNLPVHMFERDFTSGDIAFLNGLARTYCEQYSAAHSGLYPTQLAYLHELFALVPAEMQGALEWSGPQADKSRNGIPDTTPAPALPSE